MSDSTIPFQGQTAVLDRPVTDLEPESGGEGGGNRVKLLALGGVAAVAVLGVLAYFLLFAGGSEPVAQTLVPKGKPASPAPAEPEAVTPSQPRLSNKNFGRDPFKALIVPEAAPVVSTGTTSDATTGTSTAGTTTTGTTDTTATETTVPTASTSHTFKVVEVAPDNSTVTVKVDGKRYNNLEAGEVFAKYFKVVLISGQVNSFQYGEEKFNVIGTKRLTIA
ncbi:MAG TPA: hypothetical protein VFK52_11750 [Nocardioidaceae bacterium]|nr:hypothetical protein [Nocardioidaceae bacterium]